jgi:hypothetical protein
MHEYLQVKYLKPRMLNFEKFKPHEETCPNQKASLLFYSQAD